MDSARAGLNQRFVLRVIAHKDHAPLARQSVQLFLESIGANIAVEDHHTGIWFKGFERQSVLQRHGAADAAAEFLRRANTLDHDHIIGERSGVR